MSNSKQKDSDYGENGSILRRIDLNPGKSSWKIKGSKKRTSLGSKSSSEGRNWNSKKNSFTLRRENGHRDKERVDVGSI